MDVVFSVVCGSPFLLWERLGKWYNFAVGFDRRAMEIGVRWMTVLQGEDGG